MSWLRNPFMVKKFASRQDAALQMAEKLSSYRGKNPLILAIPRGAVPMGEILAEKLEGELDVVLVRKISAPGNPEYAIGAVDENGWTYMTEAPERLEPIAAHIEKEKQRQQALCQERRRQYTPIKQSANPAGRTVIVVDDGLATGATMIAALRAIRAQQPAELVCAVPVGHQESIRLVEKFADAVSCVLIPPDFRAVGQFYHDFSQVDDDEVEEILMRRKSPI